MNKETKEGRYQRLIIQLEDLLQKSEDPVAQMATVVALLYHKMEGFFWCGFYRLLDGELTVGPYQGPLACQVLQKNTGVCWAGIQTQGVVLVPNVHEFPGHIACDSRSKSEVVVPVKDRKGHIIGVLDIDSDQYNTFDEVDASYLEKIVSLVRIP